MLASKISVTMTRAAKRISTNAPAVEARFGAGPTAREEAVVAHEIATRALREIEGLRARCDMQDAMIAELWSKLRDDPPIEKEGAALDRWRPAKMLADQLGCSEALLRYWRKKDLKWEMRRGRRVWYDTQTLPEPWKSRLIGAVSPDGSPEKDDFANLRIESQRESAHDSPHGTRSNQIASSRRQGR